MGRFALGAPTLVMVGFIALVAWVAWDGTRGAPTEERMLASLRRLVPPGSPAERVSPLLERRGFTCTDFRNGQWRSYNGRVERDGIDFVYCRRAEAAGFFTGRVWQVGIVHAGGVVTEILIKSHLDGL